MKSTELNTLRRDNYLWLGLSGITTAISWVFYYKALKIGSIATIALIDKGGVVVAVLLAWLVLREVITPRMLMGGVLIIGGLLLVVKK